MLLMPDPIFGMGSERTGAVMDTEVMANLMGQAVAAMFLS